MRYFHRPELHCYRHKPGVNNLRVPISKRPSRPIDFINGVKRDLGKTIRSVASPICQEGQSERTFPIFLLPPIFYSFLVFPDILPLFPPIFWQIFRSRGHSTP